MNRELRAGGRLIFTERTSCRIFLEDLKERLSLYVAGHGAAPRLQTSDLGQVSGLLEEGAPGRLAGGLLQVAWDTQTQTQIQCNSQQRVSPGR